MEFQYTISGLIDKMIEFYYPNSSIKTHRHWRKLIINIVRESLVSQEKKIETKFRRLILAPPALPAIKLSDTQKRLLVTLYPYFCKYMKRFAQDIIPYKPSRNLKELILVIFIHEYADSTQYLLANLYFNKYYSDVKRRSRPREQMWMGKTLANILTGQQNKKCWQTIMVDK